MLEAGVVGGSASAASQMNLLKAQPSKDPGERPPIKANVGPGQVEYRCKAKAYAVTVHRSSPQPVVTPGGVAEFPEVLVRIEFQPTFHGYGRYVLGSDRTGSTRMVKVSTPNGVEEKSADQLRKEWFDKVLSSPEELAHAGLRTGALWKAEDEEVLFLTNQVKVAMAALKHAGVKEGVMKAMGDAFQIDETVGKTMKPAAPAPAPIVTEVVAAEPPVVAPVVAAEPPVAKPTPEKPKTQAPAAK